MIIGAKDGAAPVKDPDGNFTVSVTPRPVSYLSGPPQEDLQVLKDRNGDNWTFSTGKAPDGTFNILQYSPYAQTDEGGAEFSVLFDNKKGDKPTNYDWVQIARPHNWFGNPSEDKIHVDAMFSNFPFYSNYTPDEFPDLKTPSPPFRDRSAIWNDEKNYPQQTIQNPAGGGKLPAGTLLMVDEPFRPGLPDFLKGKDYAEDVFDLLLVNFTWNGKLGDEAGGTVTILDGMRWGVRISPTPEPSSFLIASLALAIGLGYGWRVRGNRPT
jgi:hypothetical protein